jgi:hypothetical protein
MKDGSASGFPEWKIYPFTLGYIESTSHTTSLESPEAVPDNVLRIKYTYMYLHPFGAHSMMLLIYETPILQAHVRWRQANKRQITYYGTAN